VSGTIVGKFSRQSTGHWRWEDARAVTDEWLKNGSWPLAVPQPQPVRILISWHQDEERTAYQAIRRLNRAQEMQVNAGGEARRWSCWSAEGRMPLILRDDAEYEEAFLDEYRRAVQSNLRTRKPCFRQGGIPARWRRWRHRCWQRRDAA